jgi:tryptophan synthase alpha subunit
MAFTSPFTAVVGASILASQWNTYGRDNITALWPYTAAGDIAYAASATTLSKLVAPAADSLLKMTASTKIPSWIATTLVGGIHAKGLVDFSPSQTFTTAWGLPSTGDITGATVTLTLSATCTVFVFATVTGFNGTAGNTFTIRAVVDGVADANAGEAFNGGDPANRDEDLQYVYYTTGVVAGSRIVKLQSQKQGTNNFVHFGRLVALAWTE